jgi:hypothetical protein
LGDVETIVGSADAEFDKIDVFTFIVLDGTDLVEDFVGDLGISTGDTEVINLTAEEYAMVLVGHLVDVALMGGGGKAHFSQDVIDVGFPEGASFGVALESMADGEDHGAIKLDTVAFEVPFSVGVIDHDISRDAGGGRVGVGIASIGGEDLHIKGGGEGHEEAHAGVFDAG